MVANLLFILLSLVWTLTLRAQPSYEKLSNQEINSASLNTAQRLADAMLSAQKRGQSYELSEAEATPSIRQEFSAEQQQQRYSAIRELFGDYQSLTFVEAYQTTTSPTYQLFRFRGKFAESDTEPEVRVVLNENGQLAGFFIRPWQDAL